MAARASPKMMKGWGVFAAVLVVLVGAGSNPGLAAVRLCEAAASALATGPTEKAARTAALAEWRAKALQHGEGYASWRIASSKLLKCLPRPSGGFECVARAEPCTIEQAPDRRELRRKRIGV